MSVSVSVFISMQSTLIVMNRCRSFLTIFSSVNVLNSKYCFIEHWTLSIERILSIEDIVRLFNYSFHIESNFVPIISIVFNRWKSPCNRNQTKKNHWTLNIQHCWIITINRYQLVFNWYVTLIIVVFHDKIIGSSIQFNEQWVLLSKWWLVINRHWANGHHLFTFNLIEYHFWVSKYMFNYTIHFHLN